MHRTEMAAPTIPFPMLRRFILHPPTYPLHSATLSQIKQFLPFPSTYFPSRSPLRFAASTRVFSQRSSDVVALFEDAPAESERETNAIDASAADTEGLKNPNFGVIRSRTPLPNLSVKEKKELASYAHSLGRKLKSQQVGKSGVTDTVVMALSETLEANELLKLKIHGTCPGEFEDVVNQLEESTGSVVVGQIGRTVILYRPSLTKLKAEEKRKRAQKSHLERQLKWKGSPQSKQPAPQSGQEPKQQGRGRRGSSRF